MMKPRTAAAGKREREPGKLEPNPELQIPKPGGISVQFSRFAPYYDRFMAKYVNYKSWASYILRIFRYYQVQPKVLLDLACGSGVPTVLLARPGLRIYGVDRSDAMIAILRGKIGGHDIHPIQSDIRDFTLPEPVDAAISLYDSINYLLTTEDLARCFQSVQRSLKPDGIFAFDMNTLFGLTTYWGDKTSVREVEDIYSIWATSYDPDTRISTLHLTFYVNENGQLMRYDEIHEERGYYLEEIRSCLDAAGFRRHDFYQHSTFQPPGATTTRLMIVAQK